MPFKALTTLIIRWILTIYITNGDKVCGKNEVKSDCAGCELKCGQSESEPCPAICRQNECYCPSDAYRRNASGECVPIAECPEGKRMS
ncbi:unnamed protein product [Dracunculus medinensis]|uniref:TIL domain-containing protein n=1 Tax=Dracunculus medinensis TaxID=318479 RepID=A0A0N4UDD7_DRAME|nr:unnamed protein product [Dracunculus medinensis]